jgi:HD superfamily phosphohydrolase YqeK
MGGEFSRNMMRFKDQPVPPAVKCHTTRRGDFRALARRLHANSMKVSRDRIA